MYSSAPAMSRIDAAKQMRKKTSKVKIVLLTMHQDSRIMAATKLAGGFGYVVKTRQGMEPARAIDEVLADHSFVYPLLRSSACILIRAVHFQVHRQPSLFVGRSFAATA